MSGPVLDTDKLRLVFQSRPDILQGIQEAADSPTRISLFNNIASFVHDQISVESEEPALKRRRVDVGQANGTNGSHQTAQGDETIDIAAAASAEELQLEIKDISVSIPQRKKYNLCFTKTFLYARTSADPTPVPGIIYRWEDIEHAFFLPVPEKTQQQFNYVFLPRGTYLPTPGKTQPQKDGPEPLVFTIPNAAPKPGSLDGKVAPQAQVAADSYSSLVNWAVPQFFRAAATRCSLAAPVELVASDPKLFHSAVRQSHRPNEKAVHVKAFRGSKDGYIFFLKTGILWGFKKPLLFLPLDRIVAVSYTSVLQRTFNIVIEVDVDGASEEIEFTMLDQEDYGGIDENYVKKYRLQDRSMAEQRKAKRELAENAKKGAGDGVAEVDGEKEDVEAEDGMTELQRAEMEAEQRLQDEEDEEEEDYDPGSDGDSEGEGTSSEEDEDGNGDGDGDEDDGEDDEEDEDL